MKNRALVFVVLVLVLALAASPALAAEGAPLEIPSLVDALTLLAQGAGVGLVLAFLAERWPWFQQLSSDRKAWVIFGLSVGLPVVAQVLLQFVPPEVWAAIEPFWNALATGFLGWAGSQAAYMGLIKPAAERERANRILE